MVEIIENLADYMNKGSDVAIDVALVNEGKGYMRAMLQQMRYHLKVRFSSLHHVGGAFLIGYCSVSFTKSSGSPYMHHSVKE